MKGFVYLLLAVSEDGMCETHKIGVSKHDPELRIRQLQTGNSGRISLLNSYQSHDYKMIERLLHARFDNYRTTSQNEWFNLSDEIVFGFLDECKKAEETAIMLKDNPFF